MRFVERWLAAGTEYAQNLPLPPEWYKSLDLGGLGSNQKNEAANCQGK